MTARTYAICLLAAFATPFVVIYGGLLVITSSDRLEKWFGDQLFKALRAPMTDRTSPRSTS